jgi:hypothetical protein
MDENMVVSMIGYSQARQSLVEWRREGRAKRVVKFAIMGLIAEQGFSATPKSEIFSVDFDEAELLFDVLRQTRRTLPGKAAELAKLQAKAANHLTKLSGDGKLF